MAGGQLPFGLAPTGELTSYTPTLSERAADWLRTKLFTDDRAGQDKANRLVNWGETMLPPFGFATSMYDAGNQAGLGNYGTAAMMAGASFIPGPEGKAVEKAGIRAFHGSPHSFDKFSMDKIGTGEGAQAYGHGLYFAENENVARGYRNMVTSSQYNSGKPILDNIASRLLRAGPDMTDAELADVLAKLYPKYTKDDIATAVQSARNAPSGSMYEVTINADPNTFLDWDKPLSEQPEAVRNALKKLNVDTGSMTAKDRVDTIEAALQGDPRLAHLLGKGGVNITGDTLYKGLSDSLGAADWPVTADAAARAQYRSNAAAKTTDVLKDAGISGIKYLDAGSRGAGDGTRNYVVFDDKLVSIVRKYGIAGASALLGYNVMDGLSDAQAAELKKAEKK